jgi:hypothetical protein
MLDLPIANAPYDIYLLYMSIIVGVNIHKYSMYATHANGNLQKSLSSNLRCFTFLRQLVGLASASLVATLQAEEATTGRVVVAITSASIAPFSSPGHIHTGGSYQIYQGNQEKNPRHVDSAVDLAVDLDIGILGSPY